jgi:signal peptide peptidase SppA
MSKTKTAGRSALPFKRQMLDSRCAAQHYGAWAIESKWFQAAITSVRNGSLKPVPVADYPDDDEDEGDGDGLYEIRDGIAVICIDGQMTKRGSSFGGCSTVAVRQALRQAAADWMVKGIVLHICSPGGTVAGTADLADDVLSVRQGRIGPGKAVVAYIADMGCSAAYWVASQCERIYANKTAIVGSIGTYTVLEDDTKFQEEMGVKWRVVSTGPYKGLGADGAVTDALVADVQREVNELNGPFLSAVSVGRGSLIPDIATVSDGRAHVAEQAQQLDSGC